MKPFLTKVVLFLSLFALLTMAFDVLYLKLRMKNLYPELYHMDQLLEEKVDAILFGSSVNRHVDPEDIDTRSIGELLDSLVVKYEVGALSHKAYQLDMFAEYVEYISTQSHKPLLIVPINIRSFSPIWDLYPPFQFPFEKDLINDVNPFIRFVDLNKSRKRETEYFKNIPVFHQEKVIGKLWEFAYPFSVMLDTRKGFIVRYMQPVQQENQKLHSLERVLSLSEKHDIPLIFYFTPVDYTKGESLEIPGFHEQLNDNLSLVKNVLDRYNVESYDLSQAIDSTHFSYTYIPTEHLNQKGRKYLSTFLSKKVSAKLSKN